MGFRTVVVLSNDQAHEWEKDPELGRKIRQGAATKNYESPLGRDLQYGSIMEQVHTDTQTLAVLDGLIGKSVASARWYPGQTDEVRNLALLKELADKMGYRISKKPKGKK